MQFQVFEFVNLDPHVVHDAQPADAFENLLLLQTMRRARHDVDFDAARRGADQSLDDDGILVTFVLDKERVLGRINKFGDALRGR